MISADQYGQNKFECHIAFHKGFPNIFYLLCINNKKALPSSSQRFHSRMVLLCLEFA